MALPIWLQAQRDNNPDLTECIETNIKIVTELERTTTTTKKKGKTQLLGPSSLLFCHVLAQTGTHNYPIFPIYASPYTLKQKTWNCTILLLTIVMGGLVQLLWAVILPAWDGTGGPSGKGSIQSRWEHPGGALNYLEETRLLGHTDNMFLHYIIIGLPADQQHIIVPILSFT